MTEIPKAFMERMQGCLGEEAEDFFATYSRPPVRGIRVNTLKTSVEHFKSITPFALESVPWAKNGFYVTDEKPGKTILHAAGVYYVQEPSAMCAAPLLDVHGGERVLDLCSAPGGKGTQLAQAMAGEGIIFLNEVNFSRAKILSSNVERMGIKNAVVTCASPDALARRLGGVFDKILVDAPCSGEGMFRKDATAIAEWSEENVRMCAERQADILHCAAQMLAPGGKLVYSTCTFSTEEDEAQISSFLSANPHFKLEKQFKLFPHQMRGEGHYAALLSRSDGEEARIKNIVPRADRVALSLFKEFAEQYLKIKFSNLYSVGNKLYSLPCGYFDCGVQILRAGVELGEIIKNRFVPSHSLAMCLGRDEANFIELDSSSALSYLSGNTFECAVDINGWAVAAYLGFPIGWCKVSGGIAKNHLPKALRINK